MDTQQRWALDWGGSNCDPQQHHHLHAGESCRGVLRTANTTGAICRTIPEPARPAFCWDPEHRPPVSPRGGFWLAPEPVLVHPVLEVLRVLLLSFFHLSQLCWGEGGPGQEGRPTPPSPSPPFRSLPGRSLAGARAALVLVTATVDPWVPLHRRPPRLPSSSHPKQFPPSAAPPSNSS